MKLNIRGDKIKITKAIDDYICDKICKLDRYFEKQDEINAFVKVSVKNNRQSIEVTIPTKNFTIRAEEDDNDLYTAIDLVVDKLDRQIKKNKSKLLNRYKDVESFEMKLDFEHDEEETVDKIVKRKTLESKPMDEEEAMLQMELVDHDFFVFKNIDEECVSVLYKRKDGKLGIINIK